MNSPKWLIIKSSINEKNIDLNDTELNECLCSYKKVLEDKKLNIVLCENIKSYEY